MGASFQGENTIIMQSLSEESLKSTQNYFQLCQRMEKTLSNGLQRHCDISETITFQRIERFLFSQQLTGAQVRGFFEKKKNRIREEGLQRPHSVVFWVMFDFC